MTCGTPMLTTTMSKTIKVLRDAGVSPTLFAKIVGVPGTSMREAARGASYLGSELEASLFVVACRLRDVVHAIAPLRCDDPESLKTLLEKDPVELRAWREQILSQ